MEEFIVRAAPKTDNKKVNIFKLHKNDDITWTEAKMRRENDHQPWQIKMGSGRAARRFKAIKEGGIGENASYFIFYKSKDSNNTYEVRPVDEWYNVSATQRYKTLTAEEAEQKFEQRHKTLNLFSVMVKKGGEGVEDGGSATDSKGFKISEMDDWDRSGDEFGGSEGEGDDEDGAKRKARKTKVKKEDDPENAPEEGKEDSDEGDFEQREVDYMSDSSSESSISDEGKREENDVKGIAESEALRDLLSTDEDEDGDGTPRKPVKLQGNRSQFDGNHDGPQSADGEDSEDSSDSDDYDVDEDKMDTMIMKKGLPAALVKQETRQEQSGGASSTTNNSSIPFQSVSVSSKRKVDAILTPGGSTASTSQSAVKRPCPPEFASSPANSHEKTIEDLIRKYLSRKPMTLKSILMTIRSKLKKMGGVTPEMDNNLVNTIASIIRRLPTERQKINNSMYVSMKQ